MPYTSGQVVKFVSGDIAVSQTDASLVAAVAGARVRVISMFVQCGATATNVTFNSKGGGAGTALFGPFQLAANGGVVLPASEYGWMRTNKGEALTATTGTGAISTIEIAYVQYTDPD